MELFFSKVKGEPGSRNGTFQIFHFPSIQAAFTCSKLTIEILEQGEKFV